MSDRERCAEQKLPTDSIACVGKIPSADHLQKWYFCYFDFRRGSESEERAKEERKGNWVI
jgi:hypothetical protein